MTKTLTEPASALHSWCWIYTTVCVTWAALCITIAAFLVSGSVKTAHSNFIQYSNAYAVHISDKVSSNQIILEGFAAMSGALGKSHPQETTRYASQIMASYPYILSLDIVKLTNPEKPNKNNKKQILKVKAFSGDFAYELKSEIKRDSAYKQSAYHPTALLAPSKKDSGLSTGMNELLADLIQPGLLDAVKNQHQVYSRPFHMAQGNIVYAIFMPVMHLSGPQHKKQNMQADNVYAVRMLVDAEKMATTDHMPLRENVNLVVYHPDFLPEDPAGQLVHSNQPGLSAVEKLIFPDFQFHKNIGATTNLIVKKQLGWTDLNLSLLFILLLATITSSLMLASALRSHHRKRMADKQGKKELWFMANHDLLTRLPNRNLFMDRMEQAIARAQRQGSNFGILFIDLNGFKQINDTYGHDTGDQSLKIVAHRLQNCLRAEDSIARLGGDEFVVLLEGVNDSKVMESAAQKIRYSLSKPFTINNYQLTIGASIGMAAFPVNGRNAEVLLKYADAKMYAEKFPLKVRVV